jgi:hypothetical protein
MQKRMVVALAAASLLVLWVGTAVAAGVPCAGTTTVVATGSGACSPGAAVCPAGDLDNVTVTVVVRDCYGQVLPGLYVDVSPAGVPPAVFCFCDSVKTVGPTDATGTTTAAYADFGGCGDLQFYATIGAVVAGPSPAITIASPDTDGDCRVTLIDFGYFALSYLTGDPCCDYDCDGTVNLVDFGTFALHYLHLCSP